MFVVLLCGLGIFVSRGFATSAPAVPCTNEASVSGSSFDYAICGLPDLDQHRAPGGTPVGTIPGLPNDGRSYCGPTAAMDAFAYFASHGASALGPGDEDWTDPANYAEITDDIATLGGLMHTGATTGTSGTNFYKGLAAWMKQRQPGVVGYLDPLVFTDTSSTANKLTLAELASAGASGNVVVAHVAFMHEEPTGAAGAQQWIVQGGHILTVSSAISPDTIGLHDPATPTTPISYQPAYTQETYQVTPVTLTFGTKGSHPVFKTATWLEIDGYTLSATFAAKGNSAFVTGFTIIGPETVTGWAPASSRITLSRALTEAGTTSFAAPGGASVLDLALDPLAARDFYLTAGSTAISALNTANGRSTSFATFTGQPQLIAYADGTQTLYGWGASGLSAYNATGRKVASIAAPQPVDALTVDQATGQVLTLSASSGLLRIYNPQLSLTATVMLPASAVAGSGDIWIVVHGGSVYVHRDGQTAVSLVPIPATPGSTSELVRSVTLAGAGGSHGLAVDDAGRIFVQSAAGALAEYQLSGQQDTGSPLAGQAVGSQLVVNTSYTSPYAGSIPFDTPTPTSPIPGCHGTQCK